MEFNYPIDYSLYNVDEITIIINLDMIEDVIHKVLTLQIIKSAIKNLNQLCAQNLKKIIYIVILKKLRDMMDMKQRKK